MKIVPLLILISFAKIALGQVPRKCYEVQLNTGEYYSNRADGNTIEEAQNAARALLVQSLSTVVTSNTNINIEAGNESSNQRFTNHTKTFSSLKLEGLNFLTCDDIKQDKKSNALPYSCLAYISKSDLNKSALNIKKTIDGYINMYEQKKLIDIFSLNDLYVAYLYTYLTPLSIPGRIDGDSVANMQVILERKLTDYLKKIDIKCTKALRHPIYPDSQLRLELKVAGEDETGLVYTLNCPSINASTQLTKFGDAVNMFDIITTPSNANEEFNCELIMNAETLPPEVKEVAGIIKLNREIKFNANMRSVIGLDFSAENEGTNVRLLPKVKHLSVRNMEWFMNGVQISDQQMPVIPASKINGPITLKINYDDSLTVTKALATATKSGKDENITSEAIVKPSTTLKPVASTSTNYGFATIETFDELQLKLKDIKDKGKGILGKKEKFAKPENCWVFLIDPDSKAVKYCLSPDKEGRTDIRSNTKYDAFETQLKGYIAIWVEMY